MSYTDCKHHIEDINYVEDGFLICRCMFCGEILKKDKLRVNDGLVLINKIPYMTLLNWSLIGRSIKPKSKAAFSYNGEYYFAKGQTRIRLRDVGLI